jgi:hypothetical protein
MNRESSQKGVSSDTANDTLLGLSFATLFFTAMAILCLLGALNHFELLGSRVTVESVGEVIELDRATGKDDHPGHLTLSINGNEKRLEVEVQPERGIHKGDTVRVLYREAHLLSNAELLELDVLSGTEPGSKLRISESRVTWTAMLLVIGTIFFIPAAAASTASTVVKALGRR